MSSMTAPVASLVALLLESLLTGAFFALFVILIILFSNSTLSSRFHRIVFVLVACLMMSLSTAHLVLSFIRIVQAFALPHLENSDLYYSSTPSPLETTKGWIFIIQTLLGDSVMIWRCYVVFDKKRIVLFLSCAPLIVNLIFGIMGTTRFIQNGGSLLQQNQLYLAGFASTTLVVNMSCSWAVVYRIWRSGREMGNLSKVCPVICTMIHSGALYSAGTLAVLVSYLVRSNGVYVALDAIVPLVGIVFSLIVLQIHFQFHMSSLFCPNFAAEASNLHTLGTLPQWRHYFSSTEHPQYQLGTTSSTLDPRLQPQGLSTYSREDYTVRPSLSSSDDARLKELSLEQRS